MHLIYQYFSAPLNLNDYRRYDSFKFTTSVLAIRKEWMNENVKYAFIRVEEEI